MGPWKSDMAPEKTPCTGFWKIRVISLGVKVFVGEGASCWVLGGVFTIVDGWNLAPPGMYETL